MYLFNETELPDFDEIERQEKEEASERHKYKRIEQLRRAVKNRYNKKRGNKKSKQKARTAPPGLYPESWTSQFRWSIRHRDKFKCKICDSVQKETIYHVHHIDYDKHNCKAGNLVTLCPSCHMKTNHDRNTWRCYLDREMLRMPVIQ